MMENKNQDSKEQSRVSRWIFKNLERKQETRWTSKLTKKIKGIGKPKTRTVF